MHCGTCWNMLTSCHMPSNSSGVSSAVPSTNICHGDVRPGVVITTATISSEKRLATSYYELSPETKTLKHPSLCLSTRHAHALIITLFETTHISLSSHSALLGDIVLAQKTGPRNPIRCGCAHVPRAHTYTHNPIFARCACCGLELQRSDTFSVRPGPNGYYTKSCHEGLFYSGMMSSSTLQSS